MAFTGVLERIGTAVEFDVTDIPNVTGLRHERGLAWDGTSMFVLMDLQLPASASLLTLCTIDLLTGVATRVGTAEDFGVNEDRISALAWNGTHLYAVLIGIGHKLYTIDRTTGVATFVADITPAVTDSAFSTISALAWDGTTMFGIERGKGALYTLDLSTGFATRVGTADAFGIDVLGGSGLTWDGFNLYSIHRLLSDPLYYLTTIDRTTGVATIVDASVVNLGLDFRFTLSGVEWNGTDLFALEGQNAEALFRAIPDVPVAQITTPRPTDAITANTFTIAYTKADAADAEPTAAIVVTPSGNMSAFSVSTPASGSLVLTRDPMLSETNTEFTASEITVTLTFADGSTDDLQLRFAEAVFVQPPDAPVIQGFVQANGRVRLTWNIPALNHSVLTGFTITQTGQATATYTTASDVTLRETPVLAPGDYTFVIVANSDAGASDDSNSVQVTVAAPIVVPDAPVLTATQNLDNTITLIWLVPELNGTSLQGFTITQTGQSSNMYTTGAAALEFITGVLDPGTYRFTIVANADTGDSPASLLRTVIIFPPSDAGPLSFSLQVSLDTDVETVIDADADADFIYLLGRGSQVFPSGRQNTLYIFNRDGTLEDSIVLSTSVPETGGLAQVGTGFVVVRNALAAGFLLYTSSGALDSIFVVTVGDRSSAVIYRESTNDYILFHLFNDRFLGKSLFATIVDRVEGIIVQAFQLYEAPDFDIYLAGAARSRDTYFIARSPDATQIDHFDLGFNSRGTFQTLHPDHPGNISSLAYSRGQLVVITGSGNAVQFWFYGDEETVAPVTTSPVRQLAIETPAFERFDIVRGDTNITDVICVNDRAVRSTAVEFVDVPGTDTLQQRLSRVQIVPEFTVPSVVIGDKLFLHTGEASAEPTDFPTSGVYTIQNIISTGDSYRQTFVCGLDV